MASEEDARASQQRIDPRVPGVVPGIVALGIHWTIMGQFYVPLQRSEESLAWHATIPSGAGSPRHIHLTQDENVYVLEGRLDAKLEDGTHTAGPGDLIRLPRGRPHALVNSSKGTVRCLHWVTPPRKLWELLIVLNNVRDRAEIARLGAEHEVYFLPD